jgi:hypothetical protein
MVTITTAQPSSNRTLRRPQHTFQIRHRPFQIQPFALAPVLPGETMKNALLQARVVSDPVKNPLVGWWYEMYLFYVKHRDMPLSSLWQSMVLSYGTDVSSGYGGGVGENYHPAGSIDWANQCLLSVIPYYFRDDGEAIDAGGAAVMGGCYTARVQSSSWLDSTLPDSQVVTGSTIAGGSTSQAVDLLIQQYELLRDMKLTTVTYEEFLRSYGVRADIAAPPNKPELLRYVRDWNYPSNTVSPTDGSASSCLTWAIAERADKDRYFSEPGFIFGCAVARPKVYLSKQIAPASSWLNDAMTWLPAVLSDRPETSLKKFANTDGPLKGGVTEANYWVDMRDLFLYGDQFVNFAMTDTTGSVAALPTVTLQKKYAAIADVEALFKAAYPASQIRADGVLALTIAGSQVDHT